MAKKGVDNRFVHSALQEAINSIKDDIISNMASHKRNATFKSVSSLSTEIKEDAYGYIGTISGNKSFKYMETGRKRGKVPKRFYEIILDWMMRKGITVHTQVVGKYNPNTWMRGMKQVAYFIAKSISEEGTALSYTKTKDDIYSTSIEKHSKELTNKVEKLFFNVVTQAFDEIK